MIILGIETSCDDTGVGIIEAEKGKIKVLSNIVSSQVKLHAPYGGVWPHLAKREHQKNLPIVYENALRESGVLEKKVDIFAVTVGPGLEPCLWVGVNFAKEISKKNKKPLIPINHIEAHILVNFLPFLEEGKEKEIKKYFPAISLIVSGGHTELVLVEKIGKYKLLGQTRDDAAGECFDKTARILGLGYPGGPEISRLAESYKSKTELKDYKSFLPRPMINQKNFDFSFSGLKTAVLYLTRKQKRKTKLFKERMAFEIQKSIVEVLLKKTERAIKIFRTKNLILGGGVVANKYLREQFNLLAKEKRLNLLVPDIHLATDNGLMVAIAAYLKRKEKIPKIDKIEALANLNF